MVMDRKYSAHVHAMDTQLIAVARSGNEDSADAVGRVVALAFAELVQAFSDLATDFYALELRLKAVENKD